MVTFDGGNGGSGTGSNHRQGDPRKEFVLVGSGRIGGPPQSFSCCRPLLDHQVQGHHLHVSLLKFLYTGREDDRYFCRLKHRHLCHSQPFVPPVHQHFPDHDLRTVLRGKWMGVLDSPEPLSFSNDLVIHIREKRNHGRELTPHPPSVWTHQTQEVFRLRIGVVGGMGWGST